MQEPLRSVRVWDLPTRLFHWLLAACVTGSVVSAKLGAAAQIWHMRLGYVVCALLAFRLLWGVVGGHWSRFASFAYGPATLLRYLRAAPDGRSAVDAGHTPLGALSVFALLAVLAAQVGTGLFVDDEIATTGPLNRFVSGTTGLALTHWHKAWGQWLVLSLVALHLGAIVYHVKAKQRTLVGPMLSGDKLLPADVPASRDNAVSRALALLLLAVCALAVTWLVRLGD